jgi:hypothetical protein
MYSKKKKQIVHDLNVVHNIDSAAKFSLQKHVHDAGCTATIGVHTTIGQYSRRIGRQPLQILCSVKQEDDFFSVSIKKKTLSSRKKNRPTTQRVFLIDTKKKKQHKKKRHKKKKRFLASPKDTERTAVVNGKKKNKKQAATVPSALEPRVGISGHAQTKSERVEAMVTLLEYMQDAIGGGGKEAGSPPPPVTAGRDSGSV